MTFGYRVSFQWSQNISRYVQMLHIIGEKRIKMHIVFQNNKIYQQWFIHTSVYVIIPVSFFLSWGPSLSSLISFLFLFLYPYCVLLFLDQQWYSFVAMPDINLLISSTFNKLLKMSLSSARWNYSEGFEKIKNLYTDIDTMACVMKWIKSTYPHV